jgi:hypothetical protein
VALASTSTGVYRDGDNPPETPNGGIHFYIGVDDGSKIPELGKIIAQRSWLKARGRYEVSKSGALLERSFFDECVYSPERLIFEAAPKLGLGLKQLPRASKLWPGGVLKTTEIRGLTTLEEAEVVGFKASAKAAKKPKADAVKSEYRTKEVATLVKQSVSKSAALEQIERVHAGVFTGTHRLQFAGLPYVTVTDVLRYPRPYHEATLRDPEQSQYPNAEYRAQLYVNEYNIFISSFRSGGRGYTLDKTEVKLDTENPLKTFDKIEATLSSGTLPDIFNWGGCLSHMGNDGAIRALTLATAPLIVGRLVRFYRLEQNKTGEWKRIKCELPDKLWRAFLEKKTGWFRC